MKILEILTVSDSQIEHLRTPYLRADALLALMKVVRANTTVNTGKGTFTAIDMVNDLDKLVLIPELDYAIKLLSDYQKTQSYSIAIPRDRYSQDLADKFNSIKERIDLIINKYPSE